MKHKIQQQRPCSATEAVYEYWVIFQVVSPCSALVRDVHEAHVVVLEGLVVVAILALESGQSGLLHGGLLPQQGASGGSGNSSGSAARSGPRCCRDKKNNYK